MNPNQPVVFMPPWWQQPPPSQPEPVAEVPPRVHVAMAVLRFLADKTAKHFAANEVAGMPAELDGQELTREEQHLQADAAAVMGHYVKGTLRPSRWDGRAAGRKANGKKLTVVDKLEGIKYNCPLCEGRAGKYGCGMCGGKGVVLVVRMED
jgi:hypothetical protein